MAEVTAPQYSFKDFASDQEVRWCPGCGDYVILRCVQKALPETGRKKEDIVFVSGIGCSSRFPYYMDTFGMHGIHGRAPAIASGVKLANPNLSVWVITGDGDALAIGGNHFIHAIRRNIDLNIILFNNKIYGLTKGQFSPTSEMGQKTKSSPFGNIQSPFSPSELALGAQARFIARVPDNIPNLMTDVFVAAEKHKGTSMIEVMQNCVIFNDGAFDEFTAKEVRDDALLQLEHGQPMIFGKEKNKGIRLNGLKLEIVKIGENGITEKDIMIHDAKSRDATLHFMLIHLRDPLPVGIIRAVEDIPFGERIHGRIDEQKKDAKHKSVNELLYSGDTYTI